MILKIFLSLALPLTVLLHNPAKIISQETEIMGLTDIRSEAQPLSVRIAPGEVLPVSVYLSNFGGEERVDVTLDYFVLNSSLEIILRQSETVAVETTSNFVKSFQLPEDIQEGSYTLKTEVRYFGQEFPAISEFTFRIENKVLGLFRDQIMVFSLITAGIALLTATIGYLLVNRYTKKRILPHDYSDIPNDERIFYELISDTIMTMQLKIGEKAIKIADKVQGIELDNKTGRIIRIDEQPSKVIAKLVEEYEKEGNFVSFTFRKP